MKGVVGEKEMNVDDTANIIIAANCWRPRNLNLSFHRHLKQYSMVPSSTYVSILKWSVKDMINHVLLARNYLVILF